MELLKSLRFLINGVFKRIYWVLPTLILDPFGVAEKLLNVNYDVPQWAVWVLFVAGWAIAIILTYHDLRMQKAALEQPTNWIDAYKIQHGKLPPVPNWLPDFVPGLKVGDVITALPIKTPSGQMWTRTPPSQQQMLQEYAGWAKSHCPELRSWEDIIWHMKQMMPKTPQGVERIRWKPPEQH